MKNIFLFTTCSLFLFGCTMNPNKEARIEKLETEIQQSIEKITKLERKVLLLEDVNDKLKTRIIALEKQ